MWRLNPFLHRFCKAAPFVAVFTASIYLVYFSLFPHIPTVSSPETTLFFYSNQLNDDLKQVSLQALRSAKKSISLQIYSLNDPEVIALLLEKQQQGVDVRVFYDPKACETLPPSLTLYPIRTSALMHRKILVLDHAVVFFSTANFTSASLKMHHNLIVGLTHRALATFLEEEILTSSSFSNDRYTLDCYLLPQSGEKALFTLLSYIQKAKTQIDIALFTLTHPLLIEALIEAKERGVKVSVALDYYTSLGSSAKAAALLKEKGILLLQGRQSELLHYKCALFDGKTLAFGSANWTQAAFEKNQDFLVVISSSIQKDHFILRRLFKEIARQTEKL